MEQHLYHYGILGQKWGVRRFQYSDGTRTPAGKKRYQNSDKRKETAKKALKIGAAAVGTALVVCGTYKLAKSGKLNGLVQTGKQAVLNLNLNTPTIGDTNRPIRGKLSSIDRAKFFGDEYRRRNKAMDTHIYNHSRL